MKSTSFYKNMFYLLDVANLNVFYCNKGYGETQGDYDKLIIEENGRRVGTSQMQQEE